MGRGESQDKDDGATVALRDVVVAGVEGEKHEVTPGPVDERAVRAFTTGQCHALALALHEQTGWPLIACEDESLDIVHFCVRTPDGRYLDITGRHEPDAFLDLEHVRAIDGEYLVEQDACWVREMAAEDPSWREPRVDLARSFVEPLLRSAGLAG